MERGESGETTGREFVELQGALKGRYSLERELGRGGMGVVYLAREVSLDRPVALKVLPPGLAEREGPRERFLREARTAARLSHPNIVPIHAVDEIDRFVFFAMAFVDGESLGERIRSRGPLPHSEARRLLREVAWALAYAHAQGVVHRDVKPDNILLEAESGRALVTDFGIALAGEAGDAGGDAPSDLVGTAEFMSPEQAAGGEVGPASDLYGLGVVGFYAVTGRLPFTGSSASEILARHLHTPPPPVASVAPGVPSRLAGPIDRCLRKDPADRFPGGEALAEALGESGRARGELPVPLRVFVKRVRDLARRSPAAALLLLMIFGPNLLVFALSTGSVTPWLLLGALLAGVVVSPLTVLAWQARKLLKAGYRLEDATHALRGDVEQKNEELAFEYGLGHGTYDRLLTFGWVGGLVLAVASVIGAVSGVPADVFAPALASGIGVGGVSALLASSRARRRRDVVGERWLKLLESRVGEWVFDGAGVALRRRLGSGSATFRPTELAIGMAADRLYEDLPRDVRRSLGDLPATVRTLESDARALRGQVAELEDVLAELGDAPEGVEAEERAKVRSEVEATRDEARARLTETVSALETIRLGLLRMHAGDATVESVTMDLDAAREVSAELEGLLEGHREVERLLAGRDPGAE